MFKYSEEEQSFINSIVTKLVPIISEKTGLSEEQAKNAVLNEMKGAAFDVLGEWWYRMLPADEEFPWDELAGIVTKNE